MLRNTQSTWVPLQSTTTSELCQYFITVVDNNVCPDEEYNFLYHIYLRLGSLSGQLPSNLFTKIIFTKQSIYNLGIKVVTLYYVALLITVLFQLETMVSTNCITWIPLPVSLFHPFRLRRTITNDSRATYYVISTFSSPTLEVLQKLPNCSNTNKIKHFSM
jgi:hypothetical protein